MRRSSTPGFRNLLLTGAAAFVLSPAVAVAQAPAPARAVYNIPAGDLGAALTSFGQQSEREIVFSADLTRNRQTRAIAGEMSSGEALAMLLAGSGLTYRVTAGGSIVVEAVQDPQSGSAAGDGAGTVEALIVTAQKREEDIQDVPIAISAFTQEQLERSQVAGGPDLITQVPNMTFTKTNFTGYSIQIRGIGTQAISATTDAAVAVAFNNTPFIRNRFFEQEFYDLQRVEVLRGPQGTLYGRNATAGVVNLISRKPTFAYEAKLSADIANYNSTRLEGMVNVPLAEDAVALRLAGAWTKRDGYSTNEITGNPIDGRDLWSTRLSLRVAPTDAIDVNLIWEHFEEDDDRLRSGKQLCNKHEVTEVAGIPTTRSTWLPSESQSVQVWSGVQGTFSQGCIPASFYAPESFQTPNGLSLPYVHPLITIGVPIVQGDPFTDPFDPYASRTQSRDLRVIESTVDPVYKAEADVVELQFTADIAEDVSLTTETAYSSDAIFSSQDYNRFNTAPGVFDASDAAGIPDSSFYRQNWMLPGPNGDIFCDPQIGCADRLVAVDLSTAKSRQFSQEVRLGSDFDGPFNFSLGANYLRYDTEEKYYVFINTLSAFAALSPYQAGGQGDVRGNLSPYQPGVTDNVECLKFGFRPPVPGTVNNVNGCVYMDPNPIGSLNDLGHNYFLSKNPYKLISYALFGEAYYNLAENVKVTAGLRWTVDKKEAPRIPSWIIAADSVGYPVAELVEQEWREPTGRLAIDWKPDFAITDETLVYASYAHGYKAGGMNPPASGVVCYFCGTNTELIEGLIGATHPKTFAPEFVDAFEVGAKNTLLDGALTLNLAAFYYDYEGYQISQIVNRAAVNQNFDATIWGLEIEADWRPLENLRLGFKGGYENTRVADGMSAVDVMDRTAGMPGWSVVRPFPTFPSNCILPTELFVGDTGSIFTEPPELVDVGNRGTGAPGPCELAYVLGVDPITGLTYTPNPTLNHPVNGSLVFHAGYAGWNPATAPNFGAGFSKDLSGNELPNAPNYTATITADYTVPLPSDWLMTLHTDLYYQSEAWTRIFNTEGYDKLKAYTNVNLAAIFQNEDLGWKVMAYVKNVFDRDSITGAFLNSDDTGLTTNVFLTEPRLYGLRVTKEFGGGPWWTGANLDHKGPFPLTVELGGQVQRQDAPYAPLAAASMANIDARLSNSADVQNQDLDWGDGRSLKLTWRPGGSDWKLSAGVRYGRTNSDTHRQQVAYDEVHNVCGLAPTHYLYPYLCPPGAPYASYYPELLSYTVVEWGQASARNREEHTIVDFAVGRDFGLGGLARSEVSLGLRKADFESTTDLTAGALTDWQVSAGWFPFGGASVAEPFRYRLYDATLRGSREFSGYGPMANWAAGLRLWGGERGGQLNVDWQVGGGALFGEQYTAFSGSDQVTEHAGRLVGTSKGWPLAVKSTASFETPEPRSDDATVPFVDLSLGLSYEVGRVNVRAGYRWERYFDVLDVGQDEPADADRTIDGPYFKVSVGFGG